MSQDLRGADLRGADLREALYPIRLDVWAVLDQAPSEVAGLRAALASGNVDGSVYKGACACLVGTIATVRGCDVDALDIRADSSRPAEQWFMPIRKGDAPADTGAEPTIEGVFRATLAVQWIDEWRASREAIAAAFGAAA